MTTATSDATVSIPRTEYESLCSLRALVAQLQHDNRRLADQLAVLIHRYFGRSSERIDPAQLRLFADEVGLLMAEQAPAEPAPAKAPPRQKRGHGRQPFAAHLPREVIELDVPACDRHCADCGQAMVPFGEEVTERGHFVPARVLIKRYVRKRYVCPAHHGVLTPSLPGSLVDKGKYEPSMYAHLVVAKYGDHLPLHRLSAIYKRHGLDLPKSTMWEMLSRVDEVVAAPILAQMRRELLQESHLQADETPVTVRLEDGKGSRTGYLWVWGRGPRRLFDFTMSRPRDGPKRMLGKWKGTLQTDGYAGYDEVTRINHLVRAGCWAHARRKLYEAWRTGSKSAAPLLAAIGRLFRIESALHRRRERLKLDEPAFLALRAEVRSRRSARVMERIDALARELRAKRATLPKSQLGKGLRYLDTQSAPLSVFLCDPKVEIHNNDSERALRHVVTGRKNWLFFGSPRGGEVGSRLFSLLATCKALDVHPEHYLEDVIRRVDTTPASQIAKLTPWAWAEARATAAAD
jgi:transposase